MAICGKCKAEGVDVAHVRRCYGMGAAPFSKSIAEGGSPADGHLEQYENALDEMGIFTNTVFGGEAPERRLRQLRGVTFHKKEEGKKAVNDALGRRPRWNPTDKVWELEATDAEWERIPATWRNGPEALPELEDGIYYLNSIDEGTLDGTYYMVYVSQNGFKVCKKLVVDEEEADFVENLWDETAEINHAEAGLGEWVYVGVSPLKHLKPEMKLDEQTGKRFGQVYGWCCMCGRTLRNEESKKAGIGPVCANK